MMIWHRVSFFRLIPASLKSHSCRHSVRHCQRSRKATAATTATTSQFSIFEELVLGKTWVSKSSSPPPTPSVSTLTEKSQKGSRGTSPTTCSRATRRTLRTPTPIEDADLTALARRSSAVISSRRCRRTTEVEDGYVVDPASRPQTVREVV